MWKLHIHTRRRSLLSFLKFEGTISNNDMTADAFDRIATLKNRYYEDNFD